MENRYEEIYNYLNEEMYPPSFNKGEKQTLRRYASKFAIIDAELYYIAGGKQRLAVRTKETAWDLFKEFHITPKGMHNGLLKTRKCLSSRFYWLGLSVDVEKWVSTCDICQTLAKPLNHNKSTVCNLKELESVEQEEQNCQAHVIKLYRKRIKDGPEKHAEYLRQEREKYLRKNTNGRLKLIKQLSCKEQNEMQVTWNIKQNKQTEALQLLIDKSLWMQKRNFFAPDAARPTLGQAEEEKVREHEAEKHLSENIVLQEDLKSIKITGAWDWLWIDTLGPLLETRSGHCYLLILVDYFTKWVEAFPMKSNSPSEVSERLCNIIFQYGCPIRILCQQKVQFINEVNSKMSNQLSMRPNLPLMYHPLTNELDRTTYLDIKR
uniref:Gypsy retrotransposon integrase-like protein 1 n=1 Tax=Erpetoichthys calabaricus TaxID=27687 RepID=A0A8C4RT79_ERPCA